MAEQEKKDNLENKESLKENTTKGKEELKQKQEELEELTDRYKRVLAEFENFKKRSNKEREGLYNSILSDIITGVLPIMDNLEKAVLAKTEDESYKQGVELVLKQLQEFLKNQGVQEIPGVGEVFDPEVHEAISSVVDENLGEKVIKEEYRKGYKIGNKVIRHSLVVVAN